MEDNNYIKGIVKIDNIPKSENKDLTFSSQAVKADIRQYWDRDFINQTINNIKNPNHQMLFRFLWMSGVRITEAINLKKSDIDFVNHTMKLKWLKSKKYLYRIAPIHPTLNTILQVYTASMLQNDRIFPISRQRAWQITKTHFNGHPHQFRHSFAVNWLRCDGDIITLHRILGHSKVQTTMEYLKIVPMDQGKELIKIQFT